MISFNEAVLVHSILIDKFGGATGLRDEKSLVSALLRPYQTFENKDLYAQPSEKAAALIESILINHPFIDGNKRIGYVLMRLVLKEFSFDIEASQDEKYVFVINIAEGKSKFDDIVKWFDAHLVKQ